MKQNNSMQYNKLNVQFVKMISLETKHCQDLTIVNISSTMIA